MYQRTLEAKLASARAYLEHKAGALKRPNGKYLGAQETRLSAKTYRYLARQQAWLLKAMASLSFFEESKGLVRIETKTVETDVTRLLSGMPYEEGMVTGIVATARGTYTKGAKQVNADLQMGRFGVSFNLVNESAVDYLKRLKALHLSNRRGSITRTTKDRIKKILIESAETGRSYGETAKIISAQGDAGVFTRARAELIAVREVGHAYGQGNLDMVREFTKKTKSIVQKEWRSVEDNKVTPECQANQAEGWIAMDETFSSGDEVAPRGSNPRCRCVTRYRVVDEDGKPT